MNALLSIELGWPAKQLSPNSRVHHMERYRYAKGSKDTAYWATKAVLGLSKFEHDGSPIRVTLTAYPADKRARDSDNLLASCKALLDGIALALGVNDSLFDPRVQWAEPVKNPRVVVLIGGGE
jgi:crossover junction endodeoxyribonuclease RusA